MPRLAFTKRREGERWIWEAAVDPASHAGLTELVLHADYDGDCARAYLNDRLVSDHYYGRFQTWELGLKNQLAGRGRLRLEFERIRRVDLRLVPVLNTWLEISWKGA